MGLTAGVVEFCRGCYRVGKLANAEQVQALSSSQVKALTTVQVAGMDEDRIEYLGSAQVQALTTAQFNALEEAARVAEHCDHPWVEAREAEHEAASLMAGTIAAAIRALKGEGDE